MMAENPVRVALFTPEEQGCGPCFDVRNLEMIIDEYHSNRSYACIKIILICSWIKALRITHLIKVDIEGSEYNILTEENISFLSQNTKQILIEFHNTSIKEYSKKIDLILKYFKNQLKYYSQNMFLKFNLNFKNQMKLD